MQTREFINGQWVTVDAPFRQYGSAQDSSQDWWNLMNRPRYGQVIGAQDFETAARAVGSSGYATDPKYSQKLLGLQPRNEEQQNFLDQRMRELIAVGAPPHLAELGAKQSALETGWGRSAPGGNLYGIKGAGDTRTGKTMDYTQMPDTIIPGPFSGGQTPPLGPQPLGGAPTLPPPPQIASEAPPEPRGFMDNLMGDPMFNIGLGILAAPGYGGNWLRGAAVGAQQGMLAHAQRQKFEQEMSSALEERKAKKAKSEATEMLARQYDQTDPVKAAMIRAGAMSQAPSYGVTPHYERGADGRLYAVQYASDGTARRTPIEGTPFAIEKTQPEYLQKQEVAKTTGREQAELDIKARESAASDIAQIEGTMATVEKLVRLPGREAATGWERNFPTFFPRTKDYEKALEQLKGQQFEVGVQKMRGLGALSNAEGDAIKAAASDINLDQSDTEHMRSLAIVYANLEKAKQRTQNRAFLPPEKREKIGPATEEEVQKVHERLFGHRSAQPVYGQPKTGGTIEGGKWQIERE